jgi:hypothetical protein
MAYVGELWQVLADLQASGFGRDRPKFAANFGGGIGLHVEALVLSQSPRQEDEDARFGLRGRFRAAGSPSLGEP